MDQVINYQNLSLTSFLAYIEAQGHQLFLSTIWGPFNARTQSIETKFINHATTVLRFTGAQQLIPFYKGYATNDQFLDSRSLPVKNETLQKEIQASITKLSNSDKGAFQSAPDFMNMLGALPQNKYHISDSVKQKLQQVQENLKKFLGSIAICIQQSLEISSLAVRGLNYILGVCPT